MTTFVTYKPHYCDLKYGEAIADKFFYIKKYGLPRNVPIFSNLSIGLINAPRIKDDDAFLCEGPFELYPLYLGRKKGKIVTMVKESTFWNLKKMGNVKKNFVIKLHSINHALITDTDFMKDIIKKYMPDMPVGVCPPFCAQPFFEVKNSVDSKNLLFIGSNDRNKGFLELIEAFKILRQKDDEWNLYLIGNCAKMINESVEGMHVLGFLKDMSPIISRCSINIHPATFEVFGVSILESMSAGLLPITTKMTGVSEALEEHGLKNLVIENNRPETIAKKVLEIYNLGLAKKRALSRKCRSIVKKKFTEDRNVMLYKKTFYSLTD